MAKVLEISNDDAKHWLQVLLYKWNNSKKAYEIIEDDKNKVMDMIDKVERYSN